MSRYEGGNNATSLMQRQRRDALDRYNCELYGDEEDGLSSYTTSDVRDTIEWLLPQVIEPFVESENAVEFTARNAEDVAQAALETAYIRDVIFQQNNGFIELYSFAKDGMLFKNGVIKSWWDVCVTEENETYKDKDFLFYVQARAEADRAPLVEDESALEISNVTVKYDDKEYTLEEAMDLPADVVETALFDIKVKKRTNDSQIRFKAIPPENFVVAAGYNSVNVDDADYCCHRDTLKPWQLREDGISQAKIDKIPFGDDEQLNVETNNRFRDDGSIWGKDAPEDNANRDITVYEHYIYADLGNGKPERWLIRTAGSNGSTILDKERVDENPFSIWTPTINPHKHYGLSTADMSVDKQLLKTVLVRRTLDSLYASINPAKAVKEGGIYKEDLLYTGPGAIYRVRENKGEIAQNIQAFSVPFVGQQALPIISMVDEMRQQATGVAGNSQALDGFKALAGGTNLVAPMVMSQDLMRVKMVVRMMAEGFKHLMKRLHNLATDYDQERMFQYDGDFQTVDPQQWMKRSQFNIKVGVGYVEKMQRAMALDKIIANQTTIAAAAGLTGPLLNARNVYVAMTEQAKLAGYVDGDKFYQNPEEWQQPEPEPSPVDEALKVEEARTVADLHKTAADNALRKQIADNDRALKERQLELEQEYKYAALQQERDLKEQEMVLKYGLGSRPIETVVANV